MEGLRGRAPSPRRVPVAGSQGAMAEDQAACSPHSCWEGGVAPRGGCHRVLELLLPVPWAGGKPGVPACAGVWPGHPRRRWTRASPAQLSPGGSPCSVPGPSLLAGPRDSPRALGRAELVVRNSLCHDRQAQGGRERQVNCGLCWGLGFAD